MSAINLKSLTEGDVLDFLNSLDTVLCDCDGVLWIYNDPIHNAAEVLNTFRDIGKNVFYITNNSTKTRKEFVEKCTQLNFKATENEILCTAHLAATYLKDLHFQKKVYVIGSTGITRELDNVGISHCGIGPDPVTDNILANVEIEPNIGAVIVGFDEHFSFPKMVKAATYLNDESVHFIATNTDPRFPTNEKIITPGTGSLVRCIETCSERKPEIMGKPSKYIADMLNKHHKIDPRRTLMIGDRLNTDILFGKRCGFKTLLVLTGCTSANDVQKLKSKCPDDELIPDYYIDCIGNLLPYLNKIKSTTVKKSTAVILNN